MLATTAVLSEKGPVILIYSIVLLKKKQGVSSRITWAPSQGVPQTCIGKFKKKKKGDEMVEDLLSAHSSSPTSCLER